MKQKENKIEKGTRFFTVYLTNKKGSFIEVKNKEFKNLQAAKKAANVTVCSNDVIEAGVREHWTLPMAGQWWVEMARTVYCAHKPF